MEIVEGVTLAATLKHGKIEPHRALNLAIDLAEILHAAHEVGVVHLWRANQRPFDSYQGF